MRVLRRSVGLALLLGVLLASAAPSALAAASDVLIVGDSLAVGTEPFLREMLADRNVVSDTKGARSTPQGMKALRTNLRYAMPQPQTVVMQLGTNDGSDPNKFTDRVQRTLSLLPVTSCVVWVTVIRPARKGPYRTLNRVLHKEKRRDPRLIVVDWEHAVTGGLVFLPDGLHADEAGYRYRAGMIAGAIHTQCDPRVPAVVPPPAVVPAI